MDWIKINTGMFSDEKILLLGNDAKGDEMVCIWLRLLLLAGRLENDGVFMLRPGTPYSVTQLATIIGKPAGKVRSAIAAFTDLGMIEMVNGAVTIPNWGKHQGSSDSMARYAEANRERQRRFREHQRNVTDNVTGNVTRNVTNRYSNVTVTHTDKDLDKDLDKDKEIFKRNDKRKGYGKGNGNGRRSPNEGYQTHGYTEADFPDSFYVNLQAAAADTEEREDDHGHDNNAEGAYGAETAR